MNVAEPFTITTSVVMLGILLFGSVGYRLLPRMALRDVDSSIIVVTATLPGAGPKTTESSVAAPLQGSSRLSQA
jgi:multidrug efflux pump subunit AcrB